MCLFWWLYGFCRGKLSATNTYGTGAPCLCGTRAEGARRADRSEHAGSLPRFGPHGCVKPYSCLVVLEYYLGVPWASPCLGSFHSLFYSPSKLHPKLENFTTQNSTENLMSSVREIKQNTTSRYCNELILNSYWCNIYCIQLLHGSYPLRESRTRGCPDSWTIIIGRIPRLWRYKI